jgi:hypothetical protein
MSSPKTFTIEDFVLTKYVANSNNGNNIPIKPNAAPLNFGFPRLLVEKCYFPLHLSITNYTKFVIFVLF